MVTANATSINVANTSNIVANVSLLLIGSEIMGVGNISGNAVGISTRGLGGTTAAEHVDGSTITAFTDVGAATTVKANNGGPSDTNVQVNALNGIDAVSYTHLTLPTILLV